jgi:hypothetical protein
MNCQILWLSWRITASWTTSYIRQVMIKFVTFTIGNPEDAIHQIHCQSGTHIVNAGSKARIVQIPQIDVDRFNELCWHQFDTIMMASMLKKRGSSVSWDAILVQISNMWRVATSYCERQSVGLVPRCFPATFGALWCSYLRRWTCRSKRNSRLTTTITQRPRLIEQ